MPSVGTSCIRCQPCEAEASSCDDVCLACLPRRLCCSVKMTFAEEYEGCCWGAFSYTMLLSCFTGSGFPTWGGVGACYDLQFNVTVVMEDNDPDEGCHVHIYVSNHDGITDLGLVTFTGFPITLSFTDVAGNVYDATIGASGGIPHPWNDRDCNPCLCARCLPPTYCFSIWRGSQNPLDLDCDPCFVMGTLSITECFTTVSTTAQCGVNTYTITLSLPDIADGNCGLMLSVAGPGLSGDPFLIGIEDISFPSTNGCFKCCQVGYSTPISRIGTCGNAALCTDCFADSAEDDNGCGLSTLTDPDVFSDIMIEEDGVDPLDWDRFIFRFKANWCGERCESEDADGAYCCKATNPPPAGAEHCYDYATTLTASFISDCGGGPDGLEITMTIADGMLCGGVTPISGWSGVGNPVECANDTIELFMICGFPGDCQNSLPGGEYCQFYRLVLRTAGNTLGSQCLTGELINCYCDPFMLEFRFAIPSKLGADPDICPNFCDAGIVTVRITR